MRFLLVGLVAAASLAALPAPPDDLLHRRAIVIDTHADTTQFVTYRGFDNDYHKADRAVAIIAGLAALAVAFFPTEAPAGVPPLSWWSRSTGVIHHLAAAILFAMFAVFALWLFRLRQDGKTETTGWRNKVYIACGLAIVACIAWAGYNGYTAREIFLPESIALVAFSFSWLVKGYAVETLFRMLSIEGKP